MQTKIALCATERKPIIVTKDKKWSENMKTRIELKFI